MGSKGGTEREGEKESERAEGKGREEKGEWAVRITDRSEREEDEGNKENIEKERRCCRGKLESKRAAATELRLDPTVPPPERKSTLSAQLQAPHCKHNSGGGSERAHGKGVCVCVSLE